MEKENESVIELDMTDWDREILYYLIRESCERNVSVNQLIVEMLEKFIETHKSDEPSH
jgi:hypothetical protein